MLEIEKKYRLTKPQREALLQRLPEVGAKFKGEEFEENTLYGGHSLDVGHTILRLRRVGRNAVLTYKQRIHTASSIKHQREDETQVTDAEAMDAILDGLGFSPALVYEKRRQTWRIGKAELVIDELPFGLFMEIEGQEPEIRDVERQLAIKGLRAERLSYPELTRRHGKRFGDVIEARFES